MQAKELLKQLQERFGDTLRESVLLLNEVTIEIAPEDLLDTCRALRDEREFRFEQMVDVCGVDYLNFGEDEWATEETSATGFSRGVNPNTAGRLSGLEEDLSVETPQQDRRYAAVYHLLSVTQNHRLRIRVFAPDNELPVIPSVVGLWNGVNWFEREAFDLYGILFEGHPDLRRILTDYGFIGHPFRKDFPLSGNVEVRYDPEKKRVVYQPVTIEPRVLVPKVIRGEELQPVALDETEAEVDKGEADA
ncbi:NADH-ubiquinone oxidoreductase chain C [hydrothermal vent metagenome]|uniref:NADH-ubiquinone oxidoreductase chain C n=1 Tax=hydrothermal vent metagenome TaxID=652676 RepID=A0A3B0XZU8_9ZZZZ